MLEIRVCCRSLETALRLASQIAQCDVSHSQQTTDNGSRAGAGAAGVGAGAAGGAAVMSEGYTEIAS